MVMDVNQTYCGNHFTIYSISNRYVVNVKLTYSSWPLNNTGLNCEDPRTRPIPYVTALHGLGLVHRRYGEAVDADGTL